MHFAISSIASSGRGLIPCICPSWIPLLMVFVSSFSWVILAHSLESRSSSCSRPTFGRPVLQYVHLECCDVPLEIGRVCTYKLTLKSAPPQFSNIRLLTGGRATVLRRRVHCLRQALQARREKRIAAGLVPASPSRCRGRPRFFSLFAHEELGGGNGHDAEGQLLARR